MTAPAAVDLSVNVGALRLSNPIIAASGTFGYGVEFAAPHRFEPPRRNRRQRASPSNRWQGAPAPRLCETPSGMLNAVGLQNIGVRAFVAEKLPALRAYRTAIIANVFGYTIEEYVGRDSGHLEAAEGLAAYELNISCPNVACGGLQFGSDPQMVAEVVSAARRAAQQTPLGEALPECHRHRRDRQSRRRRRRRRPDRRQHVPGHERRLSHPEVATWQPHRRSIRPCHSAHYYEAGLRGIQGRANPGNWLWAESTGLRTFSSISWLALRRFRWAPPPLRTPGLARGS